MFLLIAMFGLTLVSVAGYQLWQVRGCKYLLLDETRREHADERGVLK